MGGPQRGQPIGAVRCPPPPQMARRAHDNLPRLEPPDPAQRRLHPRGRERIKKNAGHKK